MEEAERQLTVVDPECQAISEESQEKWAIMETREHRAGPETWAWRPEKQPGTPSYASRWKVKTQGEAGEVHKASGRAEELDNISGTNGSRALGPGSQVAT